MDYRLDDGDTTAIDLMNAAGAKDKVCFVATVVYRSPDARQVKVLREWRDRVPVKHRATRCAVRLYYAYGRRFAGLVDSTPGLCRLTKLFLDGLARVVAVEEATPRP